MLFRIALGHTCMQFIFCYSLSLYYSTIFITCDGDIKKSSGVAQGSGDTGPVVACEKFSRWGSYVISFVKQYLFIYLL